MSEWISVEKDMPKEVDQEVWAWVVPNSGIEHDGSLTIGSFDPYMRTVKTYLSRNGDIRFNCGALQEVTHWQPKPLPPSDHP